MQKKTLRYSMMLVLVLVLTLSMVAPAAAKVGRYIDVQILAINDFHGAIDTYSTSKDAAGKYTDIPVGGAAYLAAHVKNATAVNPNTIFVGDGDLIGASPLISALFHDEPTILALSMAGMQYSSVGNHEFDEGWQELLRIQNGGCNPIDGCLVGDTYPGASFQYLAANVLVDATAKKNKPAQTLLPPYEIKNINGARIGFIGVDYENTPSIVVPSGVAGLTFKGELETINKYAKELKQKRVKSIVVLLHDGFNSAGECNNPDSSFYQLVQAVDPAVDVIITGHTHQYYVCNVGEKLVTSAYYNGRMYTDIDLTIDKSTGDVSQKSATNLWNFHDVEPDPAVANLIAEYNAVAGPIQNEPVGEITADITRDQNAAGESALGDVIADGQWLATNDPAYGGAVVAMTNPGGIRTDLTYASSPSGEGDGIVTYGEAFAVQPFSNDMVTLTLTGAQLKAVLEQQFEVNRMLQISHTLHYTWSQSAPIGSKIVSMEIDGVAVDPGASYRVTINNFLAGGGDGFTGFLAGTDLLTGFTDLSAFVDYLQANIPLAPPPLDRITVVP